MKLKACMFGVAFGLCGVQLSFAQNVGKTSDATMSTGQQVVVPADLQGTIVLEAPSCQPVAIITKRR